MAKTSLKPLEIPEDVSISCESNNLKIIGKLGEMLINIHEEVKIIQEDKAVSFCPREGLQDLAMTGTMRALTANIILGVSSGFEKKLEINGVGYRAKIEGNKIELSLGFSDPVIYSLPEGVSAELPSQNEITLKSVDKQLVGQVAAEIRKIRPPEPYKGKGVKYLDEVVRRKESKKA